MRRLGWETQECFVRSREAGGIHPTFGFLLHARKLKRIPSAPFRSALLRPPTLKNPQKMKMYHFLRVAHQTRRDCYSVHHLLAKVNSEPKHWRWKGVLFPSLLFHLLGPKLQSYWLVRSTLLKSRDLSKDDQSRQSFYRIWKNMRRVLNHKVSTVLSSVKKSGSTQWPTETLWSSSITMRILSFYAFSHVATWFETWVSFVSNSAIKWNKGNMIFDA